MVKGKKISKKQKMSQIAFEALNNEDYILLDVKLQELGYEAQGDWEKGDVSKMKKIYIREDGRKAKSYIYDKDSYNQIWIQMDSPHQEGKHIHLDDWNDFERKIDIYHS